MVLQMNDKLSELIKLYREYRKDKYSSKTIFNELHDYIHYSEEQEKFIISEAEKLSEKNE